MTTSKNILYYPIAQTYGTITLFFITQLKGNNNLNTYLLAVFLESDRQLDFDELEIGHTN